MQESLEEIQEQSCIINPQCDWKKKIKGLSPVIFWYWEPAIEPRKAWLWGKSQEG